jgi:putative copper resistance protein D
MLEAGLIAARFLHYTTVLALFGLILFPLYTFPDRAGAPPARLSQWMRGMVFVATFVALLSALGWGVFAVANMAGSLSAAADNETLWSVFQETGFGRVWVVRLALLLALLVLMAGRNRSVTDRRDWVTPFISAVLSLSLACVGHTQAHDSSSTWLFHMSADGAHLLAAGAWLGGLLSLGCLLTLAGSTLSSEHTAATRAALVRFSGMGYIAVAVLVGSGLINTCMLVGSGSALTGAAYGQLLLAKLCLFIGMLVLAAMNRFWLVPTLVGVARRNRHTAPLRRLRQHVLGEQVLGLIIILIASFLGMMHPVVGSAQ